MVLIFLINTLQHITLTDDSNFVFLCIFFEFMDVAMVHSFIIYDKLHPNVVSFLDFKLVVPESFIESFTTRIRDFQVAAQKNND